MTENVYAALRLLHATTGGAFDLDHPAMMGAGGLEARHAQLKALLNEDVSRRAATASRIREAWHEAAGVAGGSTTPAKRAAAFVAWATAQWDKRQVLDPPAAPKAPKAKRTRAKPTETAAAVLDASPDPPAPAEDDRNGPADRRPLGITFNVGDAFYAPVHDAVLLCVGVESSTRMLVYCLPDQKEGAMVDRKFSPGLAKRVVISPFVDGVEIPYAELTPRNRRFADLAREDALTQNFAPGRQEGFAQLIPFDTRGSGVCASCGNTVEAKDLHDMDGGEKICSACYSGVPNKSAKTADVSREADMAKTTKKSVKASKANGAAKARAAKAPKAKGEKGERKVRLYVVAKSMPEGTTGHKQAVYEAVEKHGPISTADLVSRLQGKHGFSDKPETARNTVAFAVSKLNVAGVIKPAPAAK